MLSLEKFSITDLQMGGTDETSHENEKVSISLIVASLLII
jgi:hypothetical protein